MGTSLVFLALFLCLHSAHFSHALSRTTRSNFESAVSGVANASISENLNSSNSSAARLALISPVVVEAFIDHLYSSSINHSCQFIFVFADQHLSKHHALRVFVTSPDASLEFPVLLAVRQQLGITSWTVPQAIDRGLSQYSCDQVNRTICPVQNYIHDPDVYTSTDQLSRDVYLEVSTISRENISFNLTLRREDIHIDVGDVVSVLASPSSAQVLRFDFPAGVDLVLIRVTSQDDLCSTLSVQNTSCPVYDTERDVSYGNLHQTMTHQAGITVSRHSFPDGMFVVLVVHGNDVRCSDNYHNINLSRVKVARIEIQEKITHDHYLSAIFGAAGVFGLFYLLSIILSVWHYIRQRREWRQITLDSQSSPEAPVEGQHVSASSSAESGDRAAIYRPSSQTQSSPFAARSSAGEADISSDDSEADMAPDLDHDKNFYRARPYVCVSELARKRPRVLSRRTRLFSWSVLTVALFYGVPVVQLVYTYQKILNQTGDEDTCYYNFLCSHPLGVLTDFNHVFSNIGYVLLGLLFVGLVKRRQLVHSKHMQLNDRIEKDCGIPRHFGLFYAMGVALMMEGVLSACYHVCPSKTDFQFDTAFMYVIAVLCMLRIYETRHADISASAYATFLMLACTMVVSVLGVWQASVYFWSLFIAAYMCSCVLLTVHFYYMGRWSCGVTSLRTSWRSVRVGWSVSRWQCCRPLYLDRFVLLVLANAINLALAVYGAVKMPHDFASYLLAIFITNLLLYTFFYIVMKLRHKEKILVQAVVYVVLCSVSWIAALYFFLHKSTSWRVTPAQSRVLNRPCLLLNFYDDHDIWHFFSASSMFFGFMILLTWDDDLVFTQRDQIPVF